MPVYETLFNKIFDSGILPTAWLEGSITPIYKYKGNSSDPANYRPITILSCLGKVFTGDNRTKNKSEIVYGHQRSRPYYYLLLPVTSKAFVFDKPLLLPLHIFLL